MSANYVAKANVETDIQERLTKQANNLRTTLANDTDFQREILLAKGVAIDDKGEIVSSEGMSDEEIATQVKAQIELKEAAWEKEKLLPKDEVIAKHSGEIGVLRVQILHLEIRDAARSAGVLEHQFEVLPGAPMSSAAVVSQTEGMFGWKEGEGDREGYWALKNLDQEKDGEFAHNPVKNSSRPLAGPVAYFESMRQDEKIAPKWFSDDRPEGADIGTTTTTRKAGEKGSGKQTLLERRNQLREGQVNTFK